jgi:F0F1-type ATP synthase membrane subunit b/b'
MNRSFATLATVFVLGAAACEKSGKDTQQQVDNAQAQAQTEITNAQVQASDKANAAQAKADEKITAAENDFDKTREDYRHTMQSNLDSLDKKISDLDAKVSKTTGDKKVELTNKASTLRAERGTFAADVTSLGATPAASWDATKARVDKEWSDIKSSSDKIVW